MYLRKIVTQGVRCFATEAKHKHIENMVKKSKVVVFMKGVPDEPRCGFSNAVVQVMKMHNVPFDAYDVLQDESLRQEIKDFSQWPTIPQVYIDGQFVGGCDIIMDMHKNGDLVEELKKVGIRSALQDQEPPTKK
ncbi:glutaredoxin-related protein 5, mitochondrial-like [Varroa jacobsoni]|uniref:Glutaredoxin-related protein 5, mitochondrial n=1 Tax=Varroa destructor TaxID=109461 RepID=A0A7M7KBI8_VARDE|nr:glutaredoxin-related protein 5, mitochondrial-like [Varroa destructor]XP_022663865.1 glutaredoxin-related protein 5, mitochondrial-like [Varroa destructor]XP_022691630.1 glutaredoxin-related protein 5, mitochondrial-like [Varroa jacobsoni]